MLNQYPYGGGGRRIFKFIAQAIYMVFLGSKVLTSGIDLDDISSISE